MDDGRQLPFDPAAQRSVLGHLMTNRGFFLLCKDRIKPGWFTHDAYYPTLWAGYLEFHEKFGRTPNSNDELLETPSLAALDAGEKNRLRTTLSMIDDQKASHGIDFLSTRLQEWLQTQIYKVSLEKSIVAFNQEKFNDALRHCRDGMREISDIKFQPDEEYSFSNYADDFTEDNVELENAVSFGNSQIDHYIHPITKNGALLRGDTTVLLAPTNVGKTTAMITVIMHNLLKGKSVLFITHEGRPEDIRTKVWQSVLGMNRTEIFDSILEVKAKNHVEQAKWNHGLKLIEQNLTFLPLNKAGLTVEEVDTIIRRKIDERVQKTLKGYDLVVDDYPGKLYSERAAASKDAYRMVQDIVYGRFVNLALEYKFHSLVAIQANREGAKASRGARQGGGREERRLLTMEDVSEAYGPMQTATNVLTINRDPIQPNVVTFYIAKSRSSETGWAVACRADYSKATTHDNTMGSTAYRGASSIAEKAEYYLKNYNNGVISHDALVSGTVG